jgi:hypothetical protein
MRIGFWFDYDQTYTFVALFTEFKRRNTNAEASGFVLNHRYWSHAKEKLPAGSVIVDLYELVGEGLTYRASANELEEFKAFDERHSLARVAYSDRHLRNYAQDQLIGLYIYLRKKFHAYIDQARPEVFLFNCVASHFAHLFYLVLRERSVQVVIPFSFGFDDLIYLCDNPYLSSPDIWQTYQRFSSGVARPTEAAKAWAEQTVARMRHQGPAYEITSYINSEHHRYRLPSPKAMASYLYNYVRYYRADPNLPTVTQRLWEMVQLRWNRPRAQKLFAKHGDIAGQDFVYFPLHFEPEIATLMFSQYSHLSVIDIVARQLPITWKLVVKDHPVMIGRRSYNYFKTIIDKYPNVIIVDPAINSQRLVSEARAVLTLNGTAFLEAVALGIPAITTSRVRFGGFGIGTFSQDLINFADVLKQALATAYNDIDLVNMLASIRQHCDQYEIAEPLGRPSVMTEGNISRMADAILLWVGQRA